VLLKANAGLVVVDDQRHRKDDGRHRPESELAVVAQDGYRRDDAQRRINGDAPAWRGQEQSLGDQQNDRINAVGDSSNDGREHGGLLDT
jgi:hypothetical protein